MTKYVPRAGQYPFAIEYPQAWHVDDAQQNRVQVYLDDENEGSSFTVALSGLQGELGARDVLVAIARYIQQTYPDLSIRVLATHSAPQTNGQLQILDAEATWTGARQQPMRALIQLRTLTIPGTGFTSFAYLGGQAPAAAFEPLRPVYVRMIKTFTI